ncbi:hypothetical protein B5M07_06450 [Sulfitobacter sp. D7]|nr:hypothetical protein B5M07_06450 [Sulfitobacter sp. D7]
MQDLRDRRMVGFGQNFRVIPSVTFSGGNFGGWPLVLAPLPLNLAFFSPLGSEVCQKTAL